MHPTQYLLFGLVGLVDKMSTSKWHFCAFRPNTHPVSSDGDDAVDGGVDDGGDDGGDDGVDDGVDDGDDDGVDGGVDDGVDGGVDDGVDGGVDDGGVGDCAVVWSPPVHTLRPFNRLVPRHQNLRAKMVKMVN